MFRTALAALATMLPAIGAIQHGPLAGADITYNVRTQSGQVRCELSAGQVDCVHGPGFLQAPIGSSGYPMNSAKVTAGGGFRWLDGDIGGGPGFQETVLQYRQTYNLAGWTILPTSQGTRFTNDATGHGMFVSVENVSPF